MKGRKRISTSKEQHLRIIHLRIIGKKSRKKEERVCRRQEFRQKFVGVKIE